MTVYQQQLDILKKSEILLKAISNTPDFIVPKEAQSYLTQAVSECCKVFSIVREEIIKNEGNLKFQTLEQYKQEKGTAPEKMEKIENEFKRIEEIRKQYFDAGLSSKPQMEFKYAIFMDAYNQLLPYLDIPNESIQVESSFDNEMEKYYSEHDVPSPEGLATDEKSKGWFYKFKKKANDAFGHIKKLKPFLSSASTLIASLALPYPILEQVNEVMKKLNVGITLSDESLQIYNANNSDKQEKPEA